MSGFPSKLLSTSTSVTWPCVLKCRHTSGRPSPFWSVVCTPRPTGQTSTPATVAQETTHSKAAMRADKCFIGSCSEYQLRCGHGTVWRHYQPWGRLTKTLRASAMDRARALQCCARETSVLLVVVVLSSRTVVAQQRPLEAQDAEPIGAGQVRLGHWRDVRAQRFLSTLRFARGPVAASRPAHRRGS